MTAAQNSASPTCKTARREFRLSAHDDDLLVEAAGLAGISVSEFIIEHAVADAETLVRAHHVIELDATNHARFLAALDAPPRPNLRWVAALRKTGSGSSTGPGVFGDETPAT